MNKRGQIFIFAAIIVGLVTFVLFTKPNIMREEILLENFGEISQNYLNEAPKVVDHSIYKERPVDEDLEDYTQNFILYARNQLDPNIGVVYIYTNGTDIIVDNQLNNEVVAFTIGSGPIDVAFAKNANIEGSLILEDTSIGGDMSTTLCEDIELKNYCIIKKSTLGAVTKVALKIDEINYDFDIETTNPNIMVIVKSTEGETTKVDEFQTII